MSASNVPTDVLELRAAEERRRLHNSVAELCLQMRNTHRGSLPATNY